MCQVSFAEPCLLSSVRETKVASTGLSRERPARPRLGRRCRRRRRALAAAGAGAAPISACSVFSMRAVSLPPGTQRFSRSSFLVNDRVGIVLAVVAALAAVLLAHRRHHAAAAAAGPRRASCARRAACVWSCQGASSSVIGRRRRSGRRASAPALCCGDSAVASPSSSAGEEAVQPDALLGGERRVLRHDGSERRAHRRVHAAASREHRLSAPRSRGGARRPGSVSSREARCAR